MLYFSVIASLIVLMAIFSAVSLQAVFAENQELYVLMDGKIKKAYYTGENIHSVFFDSNLGAIVIAHASDATLELKAPKTQKHGEQLFVLRNGEEVIPESIKTDDCFYHVQLNLKENGRTELVFVYWPEETYVRTGDCEVFVAPPLIQIQLGISLQNISCKEDLLLIQKRDNSPACVTPQTKQKLAERGWVKDSATDILENHYKTLGEINKQATIHQNNNNHEQFENQTNLMQEKLQIIASDELEMPITKVYLEEDLNFPFIPTSDITESDSFDGSPVCDIISNMPVHLQNIRSTELFQMFDAKYSGYETKLTIQDERRQDSLVHYGLVAYSDDRNNTASIHFHGNSCTGKILDTDRYFLACRDNIKDDMINTSNKNDILASFEHEEFCIIPLDPWRQSVYEYGQTVSLQLRQHQQKAETMDKKYESVMAFQEEMTRLGELSDLTSSIVSGNLDDSEIQDKINQYNDRFGGLPDEFMELIQKRK